MQTLLYFPGGPGFNANPEMQLLNPLYEKEGLSLTGWHEPSRLRPAAYPYHKKNAYRHYLRCAEQFFLSQYTNEPLAILAHCFGSYPLCHLLEKHPEKISCAILITPDFCLGKTDRNILLSVLNNYRKYDGDKAAALQVILEQYTGTFDANTEAGFMLAAEDPCLFDAYWLDEEKKKSFIRFYSGAEYSIDAEAFFDVRKSFVKAGLRNSSVPVMVIYGRHDRIISIRDELQELSRYFSNPQVTALEKAGHYPHIEEQEQTLSLIKEFIEQTKI
jgi:pimeloyl-ACP methyl ester carboxylesterase